MSLNRCCGCVNIRSSESDARIDWVVRVVFGGETQVENIAEKNDTKNIILSTWGEFSVQIKQRILAVLTALTFLGAAPAALAEVKLAVVDVQSAILNSESAKKISAQISGEFTREQESIKKLQTDAAVLLERMQKDGEVMSEAEKRKVQQQIESINNDFVYERQKLQRSIEERQKELFAGIDQRVQSAINEIVLSDDYDIILPRQAALYVGDLYDITRKVTEKLNMIDAKQ